jgi:hypothetical protein
MPPDRDEFTRRVRVYVDADLLTDMLPRDAVRQLAARMRPSSRASRKEPAPPTSRPQFSGPDLEQALYTIFSRTTEDDVPDELGNGLAAALWELHDQANHRDTLQRDAACVVSLTKHQVKWHIGA